MTSEETPPAEPPWRPLQGILVLDFSQYLAGPVAALRLGDLGARVIKIERPVSGEAGRRLSFGGMLVDGESLNFHLLNRSKQSYAADLKTPSDLDAVKELVAKADVLVHNFRPGVMERIGLGYEQARALNPRMIYAAISGYGESGPWRDRPGQDLLAQATSGLPWLSGTRNDPPVPVGTSVVDLLTSCHAAQGITALLYRRERTGKGGLVQTSLLESVLDLQVELLSAHLTDPGVVVRRGPRYTANPFIAAPYGVYPTADGFLALAMSPVDRLGTLLKLAELTAYTDPRSWWTDQDRITALLAHHLSTQTTAHWLEILLPADIWCAQVLTLPELVGSAGFAAIDMVQEVELRAPDASGAAGRVFRTTRSPVRIDGRVLTNPAGSPRLGEHTAAIDAEFTTGTN